MLKRENHATHLSNLYSFHGNGYLSTIIQKSLIEVNKMVYSEQLQSILTLIEEKCYFTFDYYPRNNSQIEIKSVKVLLDKPSDEQDFLEKLYKIITKE